GRLDARIDSLKAAGNTSIDIGMKWGAALLDARARPAIAALTAEGTDALQKVPEIFAGRPLDAGDQTLKVIVVMTDGINTTQWELKDASKRGESDVWQHPETKAFSFSSRGAPWVRLSWPDLWAQMGVAYYADRKGEPVSTYYSSIADA